MLAQVLARMSNDEQRTQLLQALRHKLASYHLTWPDVRVIVELFSPHNQTRFDVLQLLLAQANNLAAKIEMDDYIYLADQCTSHNEQLKMRLFEQLCEGLDVRKENDVERVLKMFQTASSRQKIRTIVQSKRMDAPPFSPEPLTASPLTSSVEQVTSNRILSPTLPTVDELSTSPLKRKYSVADQPCHQIMTPAWTSHENEFIQRQDLLSSIAISSSNSSLSSASEENIPIRTRSFMMSIKHTFERLKETSS